MTIDVGCQPCRCMSETLRHCGQGDTCREQLAAVRVAERLKSDTLQTRLARDQARLGRDRIGLQVITVRGAENEIEVGTVLSPEELPILLLPYPQLLQHADNGLGHRYDP